LEPAAELIAAFQIHVGRPRKTVLFVENGEVTGTGIEPDIENVGLFAERSAAAFGALAAGAHEFLGDLEYQTSEVCWRNCATTLSRTLFIGERLGAAFAIEDT
jgi:hypothetical protein